MKSHRLLFDSLFASLLLLTFTTGAEYWFQSGARSGGNSAFNNGASVEIQTITPQTVSNGSMAFWVGEKLQNGAFLQVGYVIQNQTGYYPVNCTTVGCSGTEYIEAGAAEWFYEYFLSTDNGEFLGSTGSSGSAGVNGTFNTYSFYSTGNTWYFLFNGNILGSVDLGTSSSGSNWPLAMGEIANTSSNNVHMRRVIFANLSTNKQGKFLPVPSGYASISYGVGSATGISNPYGVQEVGSRTNYFAVGSGLPLGTNNTQLWSIGYTLKTISQYGNLSSRISYTAYSVVGLSAPQAIYLNNLTRVLFKGWSGSGPGSYTGIKTNVSIMLDGDITETANWQLQYFVNITSPFSSTFGTGWFNNTSSVKYGIGNPTVYRNSTVRYVFDSWNTGDRNQNGTLQISGPIKMTVRWFTEYLVDATSLYDNITGNGWYNEGSEANIVVVKPMINISSSERIAFISWDNGNKSSTLLEKIVSPLKIRTMFSRQYLVSIVGKNAHGNVLNVSQFLVGNVLVSNNTFLNADQAYVVSGAYYKGILLSANTSISASSPSTFYVSLPVYDISVKTIDLFGLPINASVMLRYKNMSTSQTFSGKNGSIRVTNVPYGYSNGTVEYLGIRERISTSNGKEATAMFVSLTNAVIIVLVAVAVVYVVVRRRAIKK